MERPCIRPEWNLRKVNNVFREWYVKSSGTFCAECNLAYDFDDSYKALLLTRARRQTRGPRCIMCGKILRTRSQSTPISGFWKKVSSIEIPDIPVDEI